MKKIAAITMARNDDFFLEKWIDYYGTQLGTENLYISLDGEDQNIPKNKGKATVTHCKRIPGQVVAAEKRRLAHLSEAAANLLETYDLVIGTDADEFLIVDPLCGKSLAEYLSKIKCCTSVSGLGLDVGQNTHIEQAIDGSLPFLSQRSFALVSSRYTKPVVISKPVRWGAGFHRVKNHNFRIDKNLYLLHFGCFDLKMLQDRFLDRDRMAAGWERHMKKRSKTITLVTNKKALDGNVFLPIARIIQTVIRPIYAWNKPSMGVWKLVVTIPERFRNIV